MDVIEIKINRKNQSYSVEGLDHGDANIHRIVEKIAERLGIVKDKQLLREPVYQELVYENR